MTAAVSAPVPDRLRAFLDGLTDDQEARKSAAREVVPRLVDLPAADRQAWRDTLTRECGLTGGHFDELYREARRLRLRLVGGNDQGEPDDDTPPRSQRVPGMADWRYVPAGARGEGLWKLGRDERWVRTVEWCADVRERLVEIGDDGTPSALHYLIAVGPDEMVVRHDAVRKGEAWDVFPEALGMAGKPAREAMANAVSALAGGLDRTTILGRMGGHVIDGRRVYVRPDGRTVPDGAPVRLVGVSAELARLSGPVDRAATAAELDTAMREMIMRGWSPLLALGIGARTAGWSTSPVRAGWLAAGDPGSGKSLTGGCARWLYIDYQWPPVSTVSFSSTVTDIEYAIAVESDFPVVMEDLALPANAHSGEVAKATEKIDRIYRALANDTEVKGRRNKDLTRRPGNKVRTIVGANMQRVPYQVQESLYRRAVVLYIERGDNDVTWYRGNTREVLARPLRTIGDRVLTALYSVDADTARALLAECDAAGFHLLGQEMDRVAPGWSTSADQFRGVVESAGAYLGGLRLVADAAGVPFARLAEAVVKPLARSLVRQWETMRDVRSATDDLGTAAAETVRRAMLDGRAHIRDLTDRANPIVPGQTVQAQGLRELYDRGMRTGWDGKGAAFYWVPELNAVGVQSAELHAVLASYRDPRTEGYLSRSLPGALLPTGAIVPNTVQESRDSDAVWQKKVSGIRKRLIMLRADRVWDMPEGDDPPTPAAAEPVEPTPAPAPVEPVQPESPEPVEPCRVCPEPGEWCGYGTTGTELSPCLVCGEPTRIRSRCGAARTAMCRGKVTTPAREGEPPRPTARPAQGPIIGRAKRPGYALDIPLDVELANFTQIIRADDPTRFPQPVDREALAEGLDLFHKVTDWTGLEAKSAGRIGHQVLHRLTARSGSTADLERVDMPAEVDAIRPKMLDPRWVDAGRVPVIGGEPVIALDVHGQYLAATGCELGIGVPRQAGAVDAAELMMVRGKLGETCGYGQLAADIEIPGVPTPLAAGDWLVMPTLRYLVDDLGLPVELSDSWVWDASSRRLHNFYQFWRNARYALIGIEGMPAAYARAAVKSIPNTFVGGWMRSRTFNNTDSLRVDWSHHVIARARVNALRAVRSAGVTPVAMIADSAYFLGMAEASRLDIDPAQKLGKWKVEKIAPVTEQIVTAHAKGRSNLFRDAVSASHLAKDDLR